MLDFRVPDFVRVREFFPRRKFCGCWLELKVGAFAEDYHPLGRRTRGAVYFTVVSFGIGLSFIVFG